LEIKTHKKALPNLILEGLFVSGFVLFFLHHQRRWSSPFVDGFQIHYIDASSMGTHDEVVFTLLDDHVVNGYVRDLALE
jgi:hypothetical protein